MTVQHSNMSKLRAHLQVLPRPFASPVVWAGVALGAVLAGTSLVNALLVGLSATLVMAWGHSGNTFWDFHVTKLDQGEGHSRAKPYSSGQNVLTSGLLSTQAVVVNMVLWLWLSTVPLLFLRDPLLWVLWAIAVACGPIYSWAKLHYLPETILLIGFGICPVLMGALAGPGYPIGNAIAASLPFGLLFGFAAEIIDQKYDCTPQAWAKGLRSIGPWLWKTERKVAPVILFIMALAGSAHIGLGISGILAQQSLWALFAFFPAAVVAPGWDQTGRDQDRAIMIGLFCIFAYCVLLVIGQAMS